MRLQHGQLGFELSHLGLAGRKGRLQGLHAGAVVGQVGGGYLLRLGLWWAVDDGQQCLSQPGVVMGVQQWFFGRFFGCFLRQHQPWLQGFSGVGVALQPGQRVSQLGGYRNIVLAVQHMNPYAVELRRLVEHVAHLLQQRSQTVSACPQIHDEFPANGDACPSVCCIALKARGLLVLNKNGKLGHGQFQSTQ